MLSERFVCTHGNNAIYSFDYDDRHCDCTSDVEINGGIQYKENYYHFVRF